MELDDIDLKILAFLEKDARMPFTEIGDSLGIADSTVHLRVKKMVEERVISKFTITVNNEILGKVSIFLMIDVVPGHFEDLVPVLMENDRIEEIMELQGAYVAALKITANNLAEIRDEIVKIRKMPSVTRTEMRTIMKIWKAK